VSRSEEKLELARRLGADEVVQAGGTDTVARTRAACGGDGADVAIQCVGSAAVAEQASPWRRSAGASSSSARRPSRSPARAVEICWRELALLGSRGFTVDDIRAVVDLYLAGAIVTDHPRHASVRSWRRTTHSTTCARDGFCVPCSCPRTEVQP
jgi:threonine dehydrogenase-like Zn-dependent dehydrogenase